MPRGKKMVLDNGREFKAQKDAIAFFKDILNTTTSKITKDHKSYSDVLSLYKRHPEFIEKSKKEENIEYFIIKDSGEYKTKCFHAVHNDGSQTDWSYITAVKAKGDSRFQSFVDAARHSLELETHHFRDDDFTNKCRQFLRDRNFSENDFPDNWISAPTNSQYRTSLLEPTKSLFLEWYKTLRTNRR